MSEFANAVSSEGADGRLLSCIIESDSVGPDVFPKLMAACRKEKFPSPIRLIELLDRHFGESLNPAEAEQKYIRKAT